MPQSYREYIPIVTSPEKDDWSRLRIATAENGFISRFFHYKECMEFATMLVFS